MALSEIKTWIISAQGAVYLLELSVWGIFQRKLLGNDEGASFFTLFIITIVIVHRVFRTGTELDTYLSIFI